VANFPLLLAYPFIAIVEAVQLLSLDADVQLMLQPTGLPGIIFIGWGTIQLILGIFLYLSVLPLSGLALEGKKSFVVIPAAMLMYTALGRLIVHIFIASSLIDERIFGFGSFIVNASNNSLILFPLVGLIFALLYATLYRNVYHKLTDWLHVDTAKLA
jgi:hypothetical protein